MGKSKHKIILIITGIVIAAILFIMQLDLNFDEPDNNYTPNNNSHNNTSTTGGSGNNDNFRPSGSTSLLTGRGVRDNKILGETVSFKADATGKANVHTFATLNENGLSKIYFHFVDSYGFEQRSGEYSVPKKANNTKIWTSKKLHRGSWKVSLKDVYSHKTLAIARFTVKSDMVQKILDGNKQNNNTSGSDSDSYVLKIGSWASRTSIKEANVIKANSYGYGTVYTVAWLTMEKAKWVYFHFVDEYNNQQRSKGYTAGANPKGYRLWVYRSLRRGRWTVTLRDNKKNILAKKQFLVK